MRNLGILVFAVLMVIGQAVSVFSATWVVDPGGGADFETIQECIDDPGVLDGDVCSVMPGTYAENVVVPWEKKNLHLISTGGPDVTIIDGGGVGNVVTYEEADDTGTLIKGFTIRNGGERGLSCSFGGPTIDDCIITANAEGGIYTLYGHTRVLNCIITGNGSAGATGGGIFLNEGGNARIINCIIGDNVANKGGGIYGDEHSGLKVTSCTFANNTAITYGGGIVAASDTSVTITNSILWSNSAPVGAQLWIGYLLGSGSSATVSYSDIAVAGTYVESGSTLSWGLGNIETAPMFVGSNDYHLSILSPCIDAGTNLAPDLPTEDIDGDNRILDGNADGIAVTDMGADEVSCFITSLIQ